ncbi:MAG: anhydro-N-acetylmuramic acid kinase [Leptospirillia bacterium]
MGFMCGTSLDGVDGSIIVVENGTIHLASFLESPFQESLRKDLKGWMEGMAATGSPSRHLPDIADILASIEESVGHQLLREAGLSSLDLDVIGTHGITVRHHPRPHRLDFLPSLPTSRGVSYQASQPFPLAQSFRTPVVTQFRGADVALEGHGAPLAPIFHRALFAGERSRAFLNIGGIANITGLPPAGSNLPVIAFDTGPGNMLMDLATSLASEGAHPFDRDGTFAGRGQPDPELLDWLLSDSFFALPPPKSTGREEWGEERLRQILAWLTHQSAPSRRGSTPPLVRLSPQERDNLLSTLSELTAAGVEQSLSWLASPPEEIIVGGGGMRNPDLMARIARRTGLPVISSQEKGYPPQAIESMAFAYIALLTLSGRPGNIPEVTGALSPTVLGQITPPPDGLDPFCLQEIARRADIHLPSPDRPRKSG